MGRFKGRARHGSQRRVRPRTHTHARPGVVKGQSDLPALLCLESRELLRCGKLGDLVWKFYLSQCHEDPSKW